MTDSRPTTARWRAAAVRVIGVLALLTFSFLFVIVAAEAAGIISAEPIGSVDDPAPSTEAREGAAAPREAAHVAGALAVVGVGATGLIALMTRPRAAGRRYHVLSATVGMLAVVPIVGNPDNIGGQAGSVDPAFVILGIPPLVVAVLAPGGRDSAEHRVVRPLLLLAAIAAVPLLAFGVDQALMQRNTFPPTADPHHQAHWFAMAVFAFVVLGVVGTAALGAAGWRFAAGSAAAAVAAVAITSLSDADAASSFGRPGGGAALLWAVCVLVVVVRAQPGGRSRHERTAGGASSESTNSGRGRLLGRRSAATEPSRSVTSGGFVVAAVLALVVCCALPALIGAGVLAAVGGVWRNPLVVVSGVVLAGAAGYAWHRARRDQACAPPTNEPSTTERALSA